MKFELIIVTLLVAAMPVCAQAQAPQAPPPHLKRLKRRKHLQRRKRQKL